MATVSIQGGCIKIDKGNDVIYTPMGDISIKVDTNDNLLYILRDGKPLDTLTYSDISSPSGATIEDKADAIANLIGQKSGTGTLSSISATSTSAQYIAANASRLCVIINNSTSRTLYLKYASGASSSSFCYRLAANDVVEITNYTGAIFGALNSGTGTVLITELT